MTRLRPVLAGVGAVVLGLVALIATAVPASAHAYLVTSNPPDGSVIRPGPQTVTLDFNDELDSSLVRISIVDSAGHGRPAAQVTVDPQRPTRLLVGLPDLPRGVYRISFRVRDSVDLHLTDGTITLGVGTAPVGPPARPSSPPPDWLEVLMRWVGAVGLATMLGAITVAYTVVPRAFRDDSLRRSVRRSMLGVAIVGAVGALLGDTVLLGYEAISIGPLVSTFSRLLSSSSLGTRWRAESTITTALVVLLAWARFRDTHPTHDPHPTRFTRYIPWAAAALGIADAVAIGLGSHTGGSSTPTAGGVVLRAVHLLSVGTWIGGVIAVAAALAMLRKEPGSQRALLRSFGRVAAVGLTVVIASGLLLSAAEVSTITAMLTTWYGVFLMAKIVLVGAVVVLGWRHRVKVARHAGRVPFRTIVVEGAIGAVVIGLGATLAATLPARGPQFRPPPAAAPSTLTANAADLLVQVSVQPNRPGTNLVTALVSNTRRPIPAPIAGVTLRVSTPITPVQVVQAKQAADGSWSGGQLNLVPGPTTIVATVHRPQLPDAVVTMPFTINAASGVASAARRVFRSMGTDRRLGSRHRGRHRPAVCSRRTPARHPTASSPALHPSTGGPHRPGARRQRSGPMSARHNDRVIVRETSHQLRTPITIARGHAELLRGATDGSGESHLHIEIILDELDRLARLTERMLILASAGDDAFLVAVPTTLDTIVVDIARRWRGTARRNWTVDCLDDSTILVDAARVTVAVDAFVENAIQNTSDGDDIVIGACRQGHEAVFKVRDTGRGLTAQELAALQTSLEDDRAGGPHRPRDTGLGLRIARTIAAAHDGYLTIEARRGFGCTVELHLPLVAAEARTREPLGLGPIA